MKLLVFSDTHNSSGRMPCVLGMEQEVDACLFLGDGARDADRVEEAYPELPFYRVKGNCDFGSPDPLEDYVTLGGVPILLTHGHTYNVKSDLHGLQHSAAKSGARVALFGHTHIPYHEYAEGVHLFNPGSLSIPRSGPASYGVIYIEEGEPRFEIRHY